MKNLSILLFDFDGTIALGDGPVLSYAKQVADELGAGEDLLGLMRIAITGSDAEAAALDGYDAVRQVAEAAGATDEQLSRAYLASRGQLGTDAAPISAPTGLAEFLSTAGEHAERILVTNAPDIRLTEALETLGLAGLFDRVVTSAGKPAGLEAVLEEFPVDTRVLSIGDIWYNDLAPAHRRGHATALVGDFVTPGATPTFRAETLTELLPNLLDWLHAPTSLSDSATSSTLNSEG